MGVACCAMQFCTVVFEPPMFHPFKDKFEDIKIPDPEDTLFEKNN